MLLGDWQNLDTSTAQKIEEDQHEWIVQPKLDGVRALLHVEENSVRITGRSFSEVTYRLNEHQDNLPHLNNGLASLSGSILDGELVCPVDKLHTGSSTTNSALQAAVAILATSPKNAEQIQQKNQAWLQFHAFDILAYQGKEVTDLPLCDRLDCLAKVLSTINNPHIHLVPSYTINKTPIHHQILSDGGEGTVWKRIDQPYKPGKRVQHWIKRKRAIEVEAFITGFKPGTPGRGNSNQIGAIEFSILDENSKPRPIAWVSNLTDADRQAMTQQINGRVALDLAFYGRRAIIIGQDESAKSKRIRHARIKQWVPDLSPGMAVI